MVTTVAEACLGESPSSPGTAVHPENSVSISSLYSKSESLVEMGKERVPTTESEWCSHLMFGGTTKSVKKLASSGSGHEEQRSNKACNLDSTESSGKSSDRSREIVRNSGYLRLARVVFASPRFRSKDEEPDAGQNARPAHVRCFRSFGRSPDGTVAFQTSRKSFRSKLLVTESNCSPIS